MKEKYGSGFPASILSLAIFLGAAVSSRGQAVPLAKERMITKDGKQFRLTSKLKKVLNMNFTFGYNHSDGKVLLNATLKRLADQEKWTVVEIKDPNLITLTTLQEYDMVFANQICDWAGSAFPATGRTAIQNYVEQLGKSIFVVHGSGDSKQKEWAWYQSTLHPVGYNDHAPRINGTVTRPAATADHPAMEGLFPKPTVIFGEWHRFNILITESHPKAEILLTVDPSTCTGCFPEAKNRHPGGNPVSWYFPAGKGRVGYFMSGHDIDDLGGWVTGSWDRYFLQMMYYTAGYDTTSVTGIAVEPKRKYANERSRIAFHPTNPSVYVTENGAHTVRILDVKGIEVLKTMGSGLTEYDFGPELAGAPKGMYLMEVRTSRNLRTMKYVVN